jgi:hypothetical protein
MRAHLALKPAIQCEKKKQGEIALNDCQPMIGLIGF